MIKKAHDLYYSRKYDFVEDFRVRCHRTLSWLQKSQDLKDDELDLKFVSLWIAFNALYGKDLKNYQLGDKEAFQSFISEICALDSNNSLHHILWDVFSNSVKVLLENKFTFNLFWAFYNGDESAANWEEVFAQSKSKAIKAMSEQNTSQILFVVFDRLYTVCNQVMHGGSTFGSQANRIQLRDACEILENVVPVMLLIMMENYSLDRTFGQPFYPYVKDQQLKHLTTIKNGA